MRFPNASKTLMVLAGCLLVVGLFDTCWAQEIKPQPEPEVPPTIRIDLYDGSRIVGIADQRVLAFDLGFDQLEIPLAVLQRMETRKSTGKLTIELVNRDRFTATILTEKISMSTVFGVVSLRTEEIEGLYVDGARPAMRVPDNENLIVYYNFDESLNPRGRNVVGNRFHLRTGDQLISEDEVRGGVLSFRGHDHLIVPHDDALCPDQFTVAAWVNPQGARNGYEFILGKTNSAGSWMGGYALVNMSGDPNNLYFYVNSYSSQNVKTDVASDTWTHLVGVCDGKSVTLYKNGKLAGSIKLNSKVDHSSHDFMIGGDRENYRWHGDLDDVALYGRAFSATEVLEFYQAFRYDDR